MNTSDEERDESRYLAEIVSHVFKEIAEASTSIAETQRMTDKGVLRGDMVDLHLLGMDLLTLAISMLNLPLAQRNEVENSDVLNHLVEELAKVVLTQEIGFDAIRPGDFPRSNREKLKFTTERLLEAISIPDVAEQQKRLDTIGQIEQQASERIEDLIGMVRLCLPVPEEHEWVDVEEIPLCEYPDHVNGTFYNAILDHMVKCQCGKVRQEEEKQGHWAMLRLKSALETIQEDDVCFDTIFSASKASETKWQDVQVAVPRSKHLSERRVTFSSTSRINDERKGWFSMPFAWKKKRQTSIPMSRYGSLVTDHDLCRMIEEPTGTCLLLKVDAHQLKVDLKGGKIHRDICPGRALRLDHIMRTRSLRLWGRSHLAFTIAKSVWQFYNSEWMDTVWTRRRIFFLEECPRQGQVPVLFCKPYLSAKFTKTTIRKMEFRQLTRAEDDAQLNGVCHRYPIILGLGITLLEIALNKPLDLNENDLECRNAASINRLWVHGKDMLDELRSKEGWHTKLFTDVIELCFDPDLFSDMEFVDGNEEQDFETRRELLYCKIVQPLKLLRDAATKGSQVDDLEGIPLDQKPVWTHTQNIQAHAQYVSDNGKQQEPMVQADFLTLNGGKINSSKEWKDSLVDLIEKRQLIKANNPIKVAVLDTGCDGDAPIFSERIERDHIKGWKDFVIQPSLRERNMVDLDGHGTHIVTLLMTLAPGAWIYVARVAQNRKSLGASEASVVEAINHAISKWDVDIVSMSFGFNKTRASIESAIRVCGEHKIFFAAAANDGQNQDELFPACLPRVISIQGTNFKGDQLQFGPGGTKPFATLAADVPSNWIGGKPEHEMSGCSVATPIAVAIAVLMLNYVAKNSAYFSTVLVERSKTTEGMRQMFRALSGRKSHPYRYVAPFSFFKQEEENMKATLRVYLENIVSVL